MNSIDKRNSVRKDYDLIAEQYFKEFGTVLEDVDLINKFESYLEKDSLVIDLGGGSGKLTNYFNEKGYMDTHKIEDGDNYYYLQSDGTMECNGWFKDSNNNWYYAREDGSLLVKELRVLFLQGMEVTRFLVVRAHILLTAKEH